MRIIAKKNIFVALGLVLLLAAGLYWYFNQPQANSQAYNFVLLDDKSQLILSEDTNETDAAGKAEYRKRLKDWQDKVSQAVAGVDQLEVYYANMAQYYRYLGEYQKSYDSYLMALGYKNDNRIIWTGLADTLVKMHAYKSAEASYREALRLVPGAEDTIVKLAGLYDLLGEKDKVRKTYEEAMVSLVQQNVVLYSYARWLEDNNDISGAIRVYTELKKRNAENADAIGRIIDKLQKL